MVRVSVVNVFVFLLFCVCLVFVVVYNCVVWRGLGNSVMGIMCGGFVFCVVVECWFYCWCW